MGDAVTAHQQYSCGSCAPCNRWRPDLCERFVVFGTDRWGGYGQLVAVPARAVIPLRGGEDFVVAAAAQCAVSTAWSMVVSVAKVRPGETVLVPSASGGVSGAAVQAARIAGARVIASAGSRREGGGGARGWAPMSCSTIATPPSPTPSRRRPTAVESTR